MVTDRLLETFPIEPDPIAELIVAEDDIYDKEQYSEREKLLINTRARWSEDEIWQKYGLMPGKEQIQMVSREELRSQLNEKTNQLVDEVLRPVMTELTPDRLDELVNDCTDKTIFLNLIKEWEAAGETIAGVFEQNLSQADEDELGVFCVISDILTELMSVYKKVGYWDTLCGRQQLTLQNDYLAARAHRILSHDMSYLLEAVKELIGWWQPAKRSERWNPGTSQSFAHSLFLDIKPVDEETEPFIFVGFKDNYDPKSRDDNSYIGKNVLTGAVKIWYRPRSLDWLTKLVYDPEQTARTIINADGTVSQIAGEWWVSDGEAHFYPASLNAAKRGSVGQAISDFLTVGHHELGHGFDSIFLTENKRRIPPWLRLRLLQAFNQWDPHNRPVSDYVKSVVERKAITNVKFETDVTPAKESDCWVEQWAEMHKDFFTNPRQFIIDYGRETAKEMAIYIYGSEGGQGANMEERAMVWNLVTSCIGEASPDMGEAAELAYKIMMAGREKGGQTEDFTPLTDLLSRYQTEKSDHHQYEIDIDGVRVLFPLVATIRRRLLAEGRPQQSYTIFTRKDIFKQDDEVDIDALNEFRHVTMSLSVRRETLWYQDNDLPEHNIIDLGYYTLEQKRAGDSLELILTVRGKV